MRRKGDKKSTPNYDSKREQNVLLEKIGSDVKVVAEGHSILNRKIDKIDADLSEVKSELGTVKAVVMENSRDTKGLKADVKELKEGEQDDIKHITTDHEDRLKKLEAVR